MTNEITTEIKPIDIDILDPTRILLNTSLPNLSVPNKKYFFSTT